MGSIYFEIHNQRIPMTLFNDVWINDIYSVQKKEGKDLRF